MTITTSQVRFAMIGCGRMGLHHSQQIIADGRGYVAALYDFNQTAAKRLKDEFWPAAKVFESFADLLSYDGIDAAIICTPTAEHCRQAKGCLSRGWHLLCEKPLAANRAEIFELVALAEECRMRKQAFSLGYQRRFTSLFRTLRREVLSRRWGPVRAITSHNVESWQLTIPGTWRDDPSENPGGFVTDAGSHKIDGLFYVTGLKPVEVFARCQKRGSHVEIISSVNALLTEDVTLTMGFIGNAQYLGEDLHIHCESADLMIRHDELWIGRDGKRERVVADEPNSTPVSGLLDVILKGEADLSPPEAAIPVYEMTQAILESSRTGLPVR